MPDMEAVKRGRKEPRLGIVSQAGVSIQLAKDKAAELAPFGWRPEDTAELERLHTLLKSELAEQAEAKDGSRLATADQNAAFSKAKALKRNLDRAVQSLFRRETGLPVTRDAFEAGGRIGESVPRMVGYLLKVLPAVEKVSGHLAKRMGGIDPVAAIKSVQAVLESADVTQERALADLPSDTLEVYEAKGKALTLLADLIGAGRSAFDGDAIEAAKFNKDLIVRARKERAQKQPTA